MNGGASMRIPTRGMSRVLLALVAIMGCELAAAHAVPPIATAFESTVVRLTVKPGEETITAAWSYTNHWDFPLSVERFDTSCGCLAGSTQQPALAPGQSGKLTAAFAPGQHRGLLRKSIHVRFIGHEKPVELVVEATIPSHVALSTQELVWTSGASLEARSIEIKSGTGQPFSITGLLGLPENQFLVATETVEHKQHYRLQITPTSQASGQHCLQVRTDSPDPRDATQALFLRVDRSPPNSSGP